MEKRVEFPNKRGEGLVGILHTTGVGKSPAVIVCHGFTGSKEGDKYVAISRALQMAGFVVLRFDFAYSGESAGGWPAFEKMTPSGEVDDLRTAIDFMTKQPEVDASKIGVFGHSLGGEVVVLEAATDPRIRAVVSSAPVVDFLGCFQSIVGKKEEVKAKGRVPYADGEVKVNVGYAFLENGSRCFPLEEVKRVKCPLLIVHGNADGDVPIATSRLLYEEANEPKKFVEIDAANHNYEGEGQLDKMVAESLAWFKQYL